MPNMDRTGPQGQGSRTGRRMGNCPGSTGINCRRINSSESRRGFNRGLGRGCRRFAEPTQINLSKEEQVKVLEAEKAEIEKELNKLNNE